jgi:hypothetical protein
MQVKNFGKRSRTKYTHLVDQDTTIRTGGFGGSTPVKAGGNHLEGGRSYESSSERVPNRDKRRRLND